jgi:hypothetical protein
MQAGGGELIMIKSFVRFNKRLSAYCERRWPQIFSGDNCTQELLSRISNDIAVRKPHRILECGGIDRPLLEKSANYVYIGLDIEDKPGCHAVYDEFHVQSVEQPFGTRADMIISITLLEHVRNNDDAVKQMHAALTARGTTHHYVPSKYHPYSLILRLVGPRLQKKLLDLLRPEAGEVAGYPAFFDRCSPREMQRLFESVGFTEVDVRSFFRANDYFDFFFPAYLFITAFENLCRSLRWRFWCSGFVITAAKNGP